MLTNKFDSLLKANSGIDLFNSLISYLGIIVGKCKELIVKAKKSATRIKIKKI